eukprot:1858483-Rhodomonas_salina.1
MRRNATVTCNKVVGSSIGISRLAETFWRQPMRFWLGNLLWVLVCTSFEVCGTRVPSGCKSVLQVTHCKA